MMSVAFVDDHPMMLTGMVALFSELPDSRVAATGSSAQDLIEIAIQHRPDIIIADLCMPGNVFDAITTVGKIAPLTKIIAFTASLGVDTAIRALDAGASGYVLKGATTQDLLKAIHSVHAGDLYISEGFASQVVAALSNTSLRRAAEAIKLSAREDQIVRLLLRGKTNKEIASALKIGTRTVKHYMTVLMQKLQVRNRLEVVLAAQRLDEQARERKMDPSPETKLLNQRGRRMNVLPH